VALNVESTGSKGIPCQRRIQVGDIEERKRGQEVGGRLGGERASAGKDVKTLR